MFTWDQRLPRAVLLRDGATDDLYGREASVGGPPLAQQGVGGAPDSALHVDALGSVRALSDGTGAVVGSRQYAASGAPRSPSGTTPEFGFTGQWTDLEVRLVNLRARWYDSRHQRLPLEHAMQLPPRAGGQGNDPSGGYGTRDG